MAQLVVKLKPHKYTSKEPDGRGGFVYHYDAHAVRMLHEAVQEVGFGGLNEAIHAHHHNPTDPRLRRLSAKHRAQLAQPPQQLETSDPNVAEWYRQAGVDTGHGSTPSPAPASAPKPADDDPAPHHAYQHRMELSRQVPRPLLLMKARRGQQKPGHKYLRRERGPDGKWVYHYETHTQHTAPLSAEAEQQTDMFEPQASAPALSPAERLSETLDRVERQIRHLPREVGIILDTHGNELQRLDGIEIAGGHAVDFATVPDRVLYGKVITHNHPIHPDGKSFSAEDIRFLCEHHLVAMRAVGGKYRYTMRNPRNLAWNVIAPVYTDIYNDKYLAFSYDIRNGKMTISEAEIRHSHEVWLEVASIFGLEYTREEWDS